ncbi:hypothetical protein PV10_01215 [Exophiala mesophila]|uniref:PH domain-containing protein n=1 Tax=Exophiala mesophila TaxID=212818 RepID=A0A0D1ZU67_EXOME|nr:uncharacterized protein PV10_01215 [Exophiala mesophila]KIV97464.1 hypothetical protein PV10_01215 [Exophiala mesophila]
MTTSRVMPVGSLTTPHHVDVLDPDSYTAQRLKHASPEHLHMTSRRFFIGPIPEGWLNSNRKSWYKRRLELSNYTSRSVTFRAASGDYQHHRMMTGLNGPSTAARMSLSFPQPEDVDDEQTSPGDTPSETDDDDVERETRNLAPVATTEVGEGLDEDLLPEQREDEDHGADGESRRHDAAPAPGDATHNLTKVTTDTKSVVAESFKTAREETEPSEDTAPAIQIETHDSPSNEDPEGQGPSNRASLQPSGATMEDNLDANSRTGLLPAEDDAKSRRHSLIRHEPAPVSDTLPYKLGRGNTGVRFKVTEGVLQGRQRIENKAERAKDRVVRKAMRRNTLLEGTIVKMELMLTRIDTTIQQVPDDFDENESMKIETRPLKKWREFMIVARKSKKQSAHDFRLQIYKTRVIPEIDDETTKKKPTHEIRLDPKTTRVNLYSSLDKTVVIWHPYKKGTRIVIMRPSSTAHSVEWYTFLRDALGWQRPTTLQVDVPDLDVVLKVEDPFGEIHVAGLGAADEETAIAQTIAAEKAVAGRIISQCLAMLEGDPEWSSILKSWSETAKMGLAWKRYDRLEWIYGINEQKMYGSMAMQKYYDLELRPKQHFPTAAYGKKGKLHNEPPPVEGFLVRLTSQKGVQQRFGKAFFKRLYFSTQDQFLMFNRPAKSTPPHPPRLATISGSNIPSAHEIIENMPLMFDVEPYKLHDDHLAWLSNASKESAKIHDRDAVEEARRNIANLADADGYINMCNIRKVRHMKWGASVADEVLEEGSDSDVDFHEDVNDTTADDGTTKGIDGERTFEIMLDNGLVVRLQAFSKETRDEWIHRLRKLVKYWKLRTTAEMDTYKAVRRANLEQLNVDEEMEALLGQFAKKWEVGRAQASPELYNMCGISSCRSITLAGSLYMKMRRRAAFHRGQVILSGGQLIVYQGSVRKTTGEQIRRIHQDKQQVIDLKHCYVYSGLIVEDDLLYQNKTFDANHPGMAALPRVYPEDGWTSADIDVMTCFVVWMNKRKGWFRTAGAPKDENDGNKQTGNRARLRRVRQLGVPGRGIVFKCRSRAERDHWVLSVASEIERVVEMEAAKSGEEEVRFEA